MSYRRDLKRVRRARKLAGHQLRQLADFELAGLTAITLHVHARQLTITLAATTGAPFTDALRETLHERRRTLKQEARQLRQARQEGKRLRGRPGLPDHPNS